jgi:hypothetical protein
MLIRYQIIIIELQKRMKKERTTVVCNEVANWLPSLFDRRTCFVADEARSEPWRRRIKSATSATKISVVYLEFLGIDRSPPRPGSSSVGWAGPSFTIGHSSHFPLPGCMHCHQFAKY